MIINKSKLPHVLEVKGNAIPTTIYPGMVFDPSALGAYDKDSFRDFNMAKELPNYKSLSCLRRYALGDILQLVPVMRVMKEAYKFATVRILTLEPYYRFIKFLFPDIIFANAEMLVQGNFDHFGLIVNLDGILERDHSLTNEENQKHRVDIFLNFFEKEISQECLRKLWGSSVKWTREMDRIKMDTNLKKVAIQIRGSGCVKTLPLEYIKSLAYELAKKYQVILLDHDKNFGFEGKNILNLCGQLNTYEVVALLTKVDTCITMDSGMLWLAHCANCPVVTILGPTRESERLTLHPQYPKKAVSINIADEMIGCEPCFETRIHCKGKINCMNTFNRKDLTEKIQNKLIQILEC